MTLIRRATKGKDELADHHRLRTAAADPRRRSYARARRWASSCVEADLSAGVPEVEAAGTIIAYPRADGQIVDPTAAIEAAHANGGLAVVVADPLALVLLKSPGSLGADVVVGSSQRFGVPMFYGGPHAGFMAVRDGLERHLPGRLVGVSIDSAGRPAYRLALQTREQHIRREKATSNICTAQVLLAVTASMYAVYHGPDGLREIAQAVNAVARTLAAGLRAGGVTVAESDFFDTVVAEVPGAAADDRRRGSQVRHPPAPDRRRPRRHLDLGVDDRARIWSRCGRHSVSTASDDAPASLPENLLRTDEILTHPVFHEHHSETQMLRYLKKLSDRDYALDRGMIPLGSCTMKLNATSEMEPISWPGFADLHPFVPAEDAAGMHRDDRDARVLARRGHRLRRRVDPAQRRLAG